MRGFAAMLLVLSVAAATARAQAPAREPVVWPPWGHAVLGPGPLTTTLSPLGRCAGEGEPGAPVLGVDGMGFFICDFQFRFPRKFSGGLRKFLEVKKCLLFRKFGPPQAKNLGKSQGI